MAEFVCEHGGGFGGRGGNQGSRHWSRSALHECRHTVASMMIAAGVNAKALSTYMGHVSVMISLDRYGHLMSGNEEEAAGLLDGYLARALVVSGIE